MTLSSVSEALFNFKGKNLSLKDLQLNKRDVTKRFVETIGKILDRLQQEHEKRVEMLPHMIVLMERAKTQYAFLVKEVQPQDHSPLVKLTDEEQVVLAQRIAEREDLLFTQAYFLIEATESFEQGYYQFVFQPTGVKTL